MDGLGVRLASIIRAAMKDQALSGAALARLIELRTGSPYPAQNVSRRLGPTSQRPMVSVSRDLELMCQVLQLDVYVVIAEAASRAREPLAGDE